MGISNVKIIVKDIICQRNWLFDSVSDITTDKLDIVQNLPKLLRTHGFYLYCTVLTIRDGPVAIKPHKNQTVNIFCKCSVI